jgi:hypothetical protein
MQVRIQKFNSGVQFTILNKDGSARKLFGKKERSSMHAALTWYREEVQKALQARGSLITRYLTKPLNTNRFLELEPWGFAVNGSMGDTGSTPTPSRITILECYQAPLEKVAVGLDCYEFYVIKEFE